MIPSPVLLSTLDAFENDLHAAMQAADEMGWDHAHVSVESKRQGWCDALQRLDEVRRSVRPHLAEFKELATHDDLEVAGRASFLVRQALLAPADEELGRSIREMETRIDRERRIFPYPFGNDEVDVARLDAILATSTSLDERREAWHARVAVGGAIAPLVVRLFAMRRRAAQDDGFAGARARDLHLVGYAEDEVDPIFERVEKLSRERLRSQRRIDDARLANRYDLPTRDLRLWHHTHPWGIGLVPDDARWADGPFDGCDPVDTVTRYFDSLGLNVRPIQISTAPDGPLPAVRRGWATSDDIGASGRFDDNLRGVRRLIDTLCEAVLYRYPGPGLREPWKVPTHPLGARIMGRVGAVAVRQSAFVAAFSSLSRTDALGRGPELQRIHAWEQTLWARWMLAGVALERALGSCTQESRASAKQLDELDAVWQDAMGDYLGVSAEGADASGWWAAFPGIETSGAFASQELLAELLASELLARVAEASRTRTILDSLMMGQTMLRLFATHGTTRAARPHLEKFLQKTGLSSAAWQRENASFG